MDIAGEGNLGSFMTVDIISDRFLKASDRKACGPPFNLANNGRFCLPPLTLSRKKGNQISPSLTLSPLYFFPCIIVQSWKATIPGWFFRKVGESRLKK
eukprot:Gb_00517 [translate_table: standard]